MPFIRKYGSFLTLFYIKLVHFFSKVGKKVVVFGEKVVKSGPKVSPKTSLKSPLLGFTVHFCHFFDHFTKGNASFVWKKWLFCTTFDLFTTLMRRWLVKIMLLIIKFYATYFMWLCTYFIMLWDLFHHVMGPIL